MGSQRNKRDRPVGEPVRSLQDLVSVGPAMLADFALLGIKTVDELAKRDAQALYDELCRITGVRQDPCVEDAFQAAVAQARNPNLPKEQRQWYFWSRKRKRQIW